jgi:penicillin-binding protein 1C
MKRRCGLIALLVLGLTSWCALHFVPLPAGLMTKPEAGIRFTDQNGAVLRDSIINGRRFAPPIALSSLPSSLVNATIAAEDKRFWSHHGIDPIAITRALRDAVARRRVVSGASTISQQLVKMAAPRRRTVGAKFVEALQAFRLEQRWTKSKILEAYLNRVDYGNARAGSAAAAAFYFAKPPADLSVAESAFLAGLPQSPSRLNPRVHFDHALRRQKWVLARMKADGFLTAREFAQASAEPIRLAPPHQVFEAPHFVDLILKQRRLAPGTEARTTLDLPLTKVAAQSLRHRITQLRDREVQHGAVVVIENQTGNVLALVGSENYFSPAGGQINGAWASRSAGSTLKPFTYLLAFEHGATPASVVADVPVGFATPTGVYHPENYNHRCYGPVRYRIALANSLNIPAVKVLASLGGAPLLWERLRRCGLSTLTQPPAHYGLGLTIGNADARLLELVNAYASLARLGEFKPYRILRDDPIAAGVRIGRPSESYLIADILSDNFARAVAFGGDSWLKFDFPVAVKTGTSTSFRDNWAIGYTPEFTAGVWVGNFDGTPMREVSGVSGAAPILHDVFTYLHGSYGTSWYAQPSDVTEKFVHAITGKMVAADREDAVQEKFVAGSEPAAESPNDYDSSGRVKLGPEYGEWAASEQNNLAPQVAVDETATGPIRVLSPLPGTTFVLDPDLPESNRLPLKASAHGAASWECATLPCRIDGSNHFAELREGRHTLTVRDARTGASAQTWIVVKAL